MNQNNKPKFNVRDVLQVGNTPKIRIVAALCEVEYEGRLVPGYKLVPKSSPCGGHEEFTIAQVTAETIMHKLLDPLNHLPSLEDFVPYLIRGDILKMKLFPEIDKKFYVLKVMGEGPTLMVQGRFIVNGVAGNEVGAFSRASLLDVFVIDTLQTPSTPVTEVKYSLGDSIQHIKSGECYEIVMLPDVGVLENTREPAYSFRMPDGRVCHRSQSEVEEPGRFKLALIPGSNF